MRSEHILAVEGDEAYGRGLGAGAAREGLLRRRVEQGGVAMVHKVLETEIHARGTPRCVPL